MTVGKRSFDLLLASVGILILILPALFLAGTLLIIQGRPIFYVSERMKSTDKGFNLWKFRTMRPDVNDSGVSGGHKTARVTRIGRILRRTRIDEVPQLWNILRGDMSFVGPRPPLRRYVVQYPHLYARVLHSRPGLTGLATLAFHAREDRLLSACTTADETERTYVTRCIPAKARLDLIYQRRQSLLMDLFLLARTIRRICKVRNAA
jgi:lipopolysaccharide/colanic/teichoic acid biosynthesis glycosyltransferase